jgi:cytosine deaminase
VLLEKKMREWKKFLNEFVPSTDLKDETASIRACQLAIHAVELGTYGVGAVLLDDKGEVLVEGHNEVFVNDFRSDLHAEMVVINKFETSYQGSHNPDSCTLVTSLEPCPMCMTRLIFAGIGTILHVSEDPMGGMVQRKASLPPIFQGITKALSQVWGLAECSESLREAAFQIWYETEADTTQRIISRGDRRSDTA